MKKYLFSAGFMLLMAALFTGCMKDTCRNTYKIYSPIFKSLTQVRADMKSNDPEPLINTGKIYVYGSYIFLNEVDRGIHVIDNSNPAAPKNISFISIPNNVDLAVKGNYLYADSYSDIVVFDISNPLNVVPVKFMDNVIRDKNRYWTTAQQNPDQIQVIVGYSERDTTVDCETYNGWYNCPNCIMVASGGGPFTANMPQTGVGGSMARFTIVNDFLYAVSNIELYSIDIASPANPQQTSAKNLGWGIETIYPFRDKLFIGSRNGMYIFDLASPSNPVQQGQFTHATSCDPVIADGNHAFVTLRSGSPCQGFTNQLDVVDISDLSNPVLDKSYNMTNPHGLSKDGSTLFICDGDDGLKIYNAGNTDNLSMIKHITGPSTFDVIAMNGIALVVAKDGLYQYDYSNLNNIKQISKISIIK